MKDYMDRLTNWRIPGNCISICIDNKEIFTYQSGYENFEKKIKMSDKKLFNIFSCSKPICVTAALQLYEKGYFLLDDPLYEYIPQYRYMWVKDENGNIKKASNTITLRHLFTMTSGINYNLESDSIKEVRKITNNKMPTLTTVSNIAKEPLEFEPGKKWLYGLSHDVLAGVIEVISGEKFRDYVRENIFEPLCMHDSFYHNEEVIDRVAQLYKYCNSSEQRIEKLQSGSDNTQVGELIDVGKNIPYVLGDDYDSGGAGITTSVSDYSKFASALANGGIAKNGERILSPGTIDLLRTNQLNSEQLNNFNWSQLKGYGYGLGVRTMIDTAKGGSCGNIGEFGWGGAAGATVLIDPSIKMSVFYTHHMLNPQEEYYQPRLRNVIYTCINS